MTTNRIEAIDPAFQSRIHLTIRYPKLSPEAREQIWLRFLRSFCPETTIEPRDIEELANIDINGREIKNLVKTTQLLAQHEKAPLKMEHVRTVLVLVKRNAFVDT